MSRGGKWLKDATYRKSCENHWSQKKYWRIIWGKSSTVINSHQHQTPPTWHLLPAQAAKGPKGILRFDPFFCLSHHELLQSTMGIVEEISTIWPGAVFGHIPTSGKLAEIRCNCMPLIAQYKCYTNGALSGMCRPEEHSSSHPQQCKTKDLKKNAWTTMNTQKYWVQEMRCTFCTDMIPLVHAFDLASRPCEKLCHTIVRSIESYWRPAAKKSQGSLPCTSIKG